MACNGIDLRNEYRSEHQVESIGNASACFSSTTADSPSTFVGPAKSAFTRRTDVWSGFEAEFDDNAEALTSVLE